MENIITILSIVANLFMGSLAVAASAYSIRSRIMLSNKKKILTADKIITERKHFSFACQALLWIVVVWIILNIAIILGFKIHQWRSSMPIGDLVQSIGNVISMTATCLTIMVIGQIQIKRIKHIELKEVIRTRKQFKNAIVGVSICFFCFAISNMAGWLISWLSKYSISENWMNFAYIIVNYVTIVGVIYSGTFLSWNGYHYAKAEDDVSMIHYKKALTASLLSTVAIAGTLLVGNFMVAASGLFVDDSKDYAAWVHIWFSFIIAVATYMLIVAWILAWLNYQKQSDDIKQAADAKRRVVNLMTAWISTLALLVMINVLTDAVNSIFGYVNYRNLHLDTFLNKLAQEIISLVVVGIGTNLAFHYVKKGFSKNIEEEMNARGSIRNSWLALILALSASAIDGIIWAVTAYMGAVH